MRTLAGRVAIGAAFLFLCGGFAHAANELITGKKLLIKNSGGGNKVVYLSKDTSITTAAAAGTGDPRCSGAGGGGGALRVRGQGGDFTITLPCADWSANGPETLYKFHDSTQATCTIVQVKNGTLVKAICKGAQVAYTLGTAQGNVDVTVRTGSAPQRYCATFGPPPTQVVKDGSDGKTYLAKSSPAPGSCAASPSGAFLDDSGLF
jgi:hypothetical protein